MTCANANHMKQTLIALAVLVVIGLILLYLFARGTTFENRVDAPNDGLAATSTRTATSTGVVGGAATGSLDADLAPYYYKG